MIDIMVDLNSFFVFASCVLDCWIVSCSCVCTYAPRRSLSSGAAAAATARSAETSPQSW